MYVDAYKLLKLFQIWILLVTTFVISLIVICTEEWLQKRKFKLAIYSYKHKYNLPNLSFLI